MAFMVRLSKGATGQAFPTSTLCVWQQQSLKAHKSIPAVMPVMSYEALCEARLPGLSLCGSNTPFER